MNWYIVGTHWIRCEIVSNMFGTAAVRLYNEPNVLRYGKPRRGLYGTLVDAK